MSNVTDYIEAITELDNERNKLNLLEGRWKIDAEDYDVSSLDAQVHEDYIEDYAAAWGCEATFAEVDLSLEQRIESLVWQLADALAFSFEEAAKYYNQQVTKGAMK